MTCWLKFLQKVSGMLKSVEPDLYKRKQLAILILKELEKEKGHNVDAIGKAIDEEGATGIAKRARKRRRISERSEGETEVLEASATS